MPLLDAPPYPADTFERPTSLPTWLRLQADRRGQAIALRHKRLGIWQAYSWQRVHAEVGALAAQLSARGFRAGSVLTLLSRPRPEPLLLALAAQWVGGSARLLDPEQAPERIHHLLASFRPEAVFVEDHAHSRLLTHGFRPPLLIQADEKGDAATSALSYAQCVRASGKTIPPVCARGEDPAFLFHRITTGGHIETQTQSHAELIHAASTLIAAESLDDSDEAFAARAFAAGGQARYLLTPWLIAGFRLNFPEQLATRDQDRRELGPTLVAGTRETYSRVESLVRAQLPVHGTFQRRLVDWALSAHGPLSRHLGEWLVRRPLRDVMGFSRTRSPLLVGAPLSPESARFFCSLGIEIRTWPDLDAWHAPSRPMLVDGWVAQPAHA